MKLLTILAILPIIANADDTALLQDKINAGGQVILESREYLLSAPVYIKSGVQLLGSGGTRLHFINSGLFVDGKVNGSHVSGWKIENLHILRDGLPGCALHLGGDATIGANKGAIRGVVRDVTIDGSSGDGIGLANSYIVNFYSTSVYNSAGYGIAIRYTPERAATGLGISFTGGEVKANRKGGIFMQHTFGVTMNGVIIEGNKGVGLTLVDGNRGVSSYGGYFESNKIADIVIKNSYAVHIDGAVFQDGFDDKPCAVRAQDSVSVNVTNNFFQGYGKRPICGDKFRSISNVSKFGNTVVELTEK